MIVRDSLCHEFLDKCIECKSLRFEFVTEGRDCKTSRSEVEKAMKNETDDTR